MKFDDLPAYKRGQVALRFATLVTALTGVTILLLLLFMGEPPHPM